MFYFLMKRNSELYLEKKLKKIEFGMLKQEEMLIEEEGMDVELFLQRSVIVLSAVENVLRIFVVTGFLINPFF